MLEYLTYGTYVFPDWVGMGSAFGTPPTVTDIRKEFITFDVTVIAFYKNYATVW